MNVYKMNGYKDRDDYLRCLAEDNGCDLGLVQALADLLGPNKDFDGLATAVEDLGNDKLLDLFGDT